MKTYVSLCSFLVCLLCLSPLLFTFTDFSKNVLNESDSPETGVTLQGSGLNVNLL